MGLTYKPTIREPSKEMKLIIKGTFDERNQKMIDNKRKIMEENKDKEVNLSAIKESKINNELIDKLYTQRIDKFIEKNAIPDKQKLELKFEKDYLRSYTKDQQHTLLQNEKSPEKVNRIQIASSKSQKNLLSNKIIEKEKEREKQTVITRYSEMRLTQYNKKTNNNDDHTFYEKTMNNSFIKDVKYVKSTNEKETLKEEFDLNNFIEDDKIILTYNNIVNNKVTIERPTQNVVAPELTIESVQIKIENIDKKEQVNNTEKDKDKRKVTATAIVSDFKEVDKDQDELDRIDKDQLNLNPMKYKRKARDKTKLDSEIIHKEM